jgi:hypothetical protein
MGVLLREVVGYVKEKDGYVRMTGVLIRKVAGYAREKDGYVRMTGVLIREVVGYTWGSLRGLNEGYWWLSETDGWLSQGNGSTKRINLSHLRLLSEDFLSPPWLVEVEWGAMALECGAMALECGAMSGNVSRIVSAKLPRPFEGRVLQHHLNCIVQNLLDRILFFVYFWVLGFTRETSYK